MKAYIAPLKKIEYGFGYIKKRSPYTPYPIFLRGIIPSCQGTDYFMKCRISQAWSFLSSIGGLKSCDIDQLLHRHSNARGSTSA